MKYYVYKTINKESGRYYVGVHKSDNIEKDSYLGSGIAIKDSIKKYGRESFKREILFEFENSDEAYAKEREIVNEEFVNSEETYNLTIGGEGIIQLTPEQKIKHSNSLKGRIFTEEHKQNISKSRIGKKMDEETKKKLSIANSGENHPMFGWRGEQCSNFGKPLSEEHKNKIGEANSGENHYLFGKKHSEETRIKMSESQRNLSNIEEKSKKHSERMSGEGNPWFGKHLSEEHKQKIVNANTGKKRSDESRFKQSKPVVIFGVEYKSIPEASKAVGINKATLYDYVGRNQSKHPDCFYIKVG